MILEQDAAARQAIQVRRLHNRVPLAAQRIRAMVVSEKQDDFGNFEVSAAASAETAAKSRNRVARKSWEWSDFNRQTGSGHTLLSPPQSWRSSGSTALSLRMAAADSVSDGSKHQMRYGFHAFRISSAARRGLLQDESEPAFVELPKEFIP